LSPFSFYFPYSLPFPFLFATLYSSIFVLSILLSSFSHCLSLVLLLFFPFLKICNLQNYSHPSPSTISPHYFTLIPHTILSFLPSHLHLPLNSFSPLHSIKPTCHFLPPTPLPPCPSLSPSKFFFSTFYHTHLSYLNPTLCPFLLARLHCL
jgi:hypothetical protein